MLTEIVVDSAVAKKGDTVKFEYVYCNDGRPYIEKIEGNVISLKNTINGDGYLCVEVNKINNMPIVRRQIFVVNRIIRNTFGILKEK